MKRDKERLLSEVIKSIEEMDTEELFLLAEFVLQLEKAVPIDDASVQKCAKKPKEA